MLAQDRRLLRDLVIVMASSTAGLIVIGTSCLNRNPIRTDTLASRANLGGVRGGNGGVPPAVGTTTLSSGQLDGGAGASDRVANPYERPGDVPPRERFVPPPMPPMATPPMPYPAAPFPNRAAPPPPAGFPNHASPPPERPEAQQPTRPFPGEPRGGPAVAPHDAAPHADVPATPTATSVFRTPTEGVEGGAGSFITESPPFGASSMPPNPEADAGAFGTEPQAPAP